MKYNSFYDLFHPEIFTKTMIKRKKKDAESVHQEIDNDIAGFTNYFTAPNIRNKVKHPLFLAYRFSSCVMLFFNQDHFPVGEKHDQIIEKTVGVLLDHHHSSSQSQNHLKNKKSLNGIDKVNSQAFLTIVINAQSGNNMFMNKKVVPKNKYY